MHPRAHYLTNLIDEFSPYPSISTRQVNELKGLEKKSDNLLQHNTFRPRKGVKIDER